METIGQRDLRTFLSNSGDNISDENDDPQRASCSQIRKDRGVKVGNYLELAQKVAAVQYHNPDYIFLYRGQPADYLRKGATTLKPSIFRASKSDPPSKQGLPDRNELIARYELLLKAEHLLTEMYPHQSGRKRLKRQRILRWALLQHYDICDTPLLDVTHSLRIAASFATSSNSNEAFLYMLGMPSISAAVTASAEAGLQVVRLSTACPPEVRRPHLQEGYLLGEYPDIPDISQKDNYDAYEVDFGRRLVAKFIFFPSTFWNANGHYPLVPEEALYPNEGDYLVALRKIIRQQLGLG